MLSNCYEKAKGENRQLEVAKQYVNSIYSVGRDIHHKTFGNGIVKGNDGIFITVDFSDVGIKRLETTVAVARRVVSVDEEGYLEKLSEYLDYLIREKYILSALKTTEIELNPYIEYLE